jgi:hypothetical protein
MVDANHELFHAMLHGLKVLDAYVETLDARDRAADAVDIERDMETLAAGGGRADGSNIEIRTKFHATHDALTEVAPAPTADDLLGAATESADDTAIGGTFDRVLLLETVIKMCDELGPARCAFSGRKLHSRVPLDPTHVCLKRTGV